MTERVALASAADYRPRTVEDAIDAVLEPLGGLERFVSAGQTVLLKPNMLAGKPPEQAVTTHPQIVREMILRVQRLGATALVGDSPGIGSPRQVARKCGLLEVIEETGATFAPFATSVRVGAEGGTFHNLELARDVLEADVVINLPKLKTHQMMGLTCAVKNLFGAVVGMRKPRLHLQAGSDKKFFALMLLELAAYIGPQLTLVDAVTAMEGDGPGSGDPVHVGALLASTSPVALDTVALELLGLDADTIWTQKVAVEKKFSGSLPDQIEILGETPQSLRPERFRPSKTTDVNFGLPPAILRPFKKAITAFPDPDMMLCEKCGLCVKHCPPQSMKIEDGTLQIDYQRCIRCFCCQELCPKGAILTRQGLLLRLHQFLHGGS
ncbi:MAG: DUF362 domain-containing protein [Desulfuromonadales bacterium]|nr:DUF362 domain-containing protein [Desulfuromonadales bacterium]NIR33415.1 DUF362 domain-containing protein [Desulfuromonadales bacterium]NIS43406.1 DUF362 domain-containing protein [Desulfuromonadales bacterium]